MITIPEELIKKGRIHINGSSSSQIFHPETEVDQVIGLQDALSNVSGGLPSQTGNSGKYLTTNGTSASWATVDALPTQTNNSGKVLATNGTTAAWTGLNSVQQVFNVGSSTASVTIDSANIPTGNLGYSIAVYHDGLRLVKNVDYTYNTSTRVISFNRTFLNNDQVVVYIGVLAEVDSLDTRTDSIHPSEKCIVNNSATGSVALNIDNSVIYDLNITGNTTLSFTKDSTLGIYSSNRSFTVTLLLRNGGAYTIAWPNSVKWSGGTAPTLSTNKCDIITLITFDSGTTWLGLLSGSNYTLS